MVSQSPQLSQEEQAVIRYFQQHVRHQEAGTIWVCHEQQEYLLDVESFYVYPEIPETHLKTAQSRYDVINGYDGIFLCLFTNTAKAWTEDIAIITTKKIYWWDAAKKRAFDVPFGDIVATGFQATKPFRGLKIVLPDQQRVVVPMQFHDALIQALAKFVGTVHGHVGFHRIDINSAPLETLMTLPGISERLAAFLIQQRQALFGIKDFKHLVAVLGLGPEESGPLKNRVVFHPYQAVQPKGRRVDF